ncbi:TetR/AcrR family transcriptional regulator [Microtetraspora niveoalba]|uniref:TetR/AcrR family transcriptional regulator n=1 Tax=Microtetraspora niveoalba TaxID=46175 RepID=UPI00082B83EF|nr:TetR family transcriptional regulator [Microtetraspora niveoalba]
MSNQRVTLIGDTAITLLAERGMRGLTHRAVDEAAGLPPGSTSNHARTRAALLGLALARLTELERALFAGLGTDPGAEEAPVEGAVEGATEELVDGLVENLTRIMHRALTRDRHVTIARYELALEATRRPELREIYDQAGRGFREPAVALLAAVGSPDPVRHGRQAVAFAEGILFDAIVGAGATPSVEDLRAAFAEFLRGALSGAAPSGRTVSAR